MSRWLARLQDEEKNTKTPSDGTDKTDKTLSGEVLSVLSVRQTGECEKNCGSVQALSSAATGSEVATYRRLQPGGNKAHPATLATTATECVDQVQNVANVASAAGLVLDFGNDASLNKGGGRGEAGALQAPITATPHHLTFVPRPGPGVVIRAPAIEVSAKEYDAHLDRLIREAGAGSDGRLIAIKRKGSVVPRGDDWIFTRGRA